jgi:hypothetical protein
VTGHSARRTVQDGERVPGAGTVSGAPGAGGVDRAGPEAVDTGRGLCPPDHRSASSLCAFRLACPRGRLRAHESVKRRAQQPSRAACPPAGGGNPWRTVSTMRIETRQRTGRAGGLAAHVHHAIRVHAHLCRCGPPPRPAASLGRVRPRPARAASPRIFDAYLVWPVDPSRGIHAETGPLGSRVHADPRLAATMRTAPETIDPRVEASQRQAVRHSRNV